MNSPSPKSSSALSSKLILFALTHLQTFLWKNNFVFENLLFQHLIACRHNLEGMLQRSQRFGGVYFPISPIKAPSKSCHIHMYVEHVPRGAAGAAPRTSQKSNQNSTLRAFSRVVIAGSHILVTARLPVRPLGQLSSVLATTSEPRVLATATSRPSPPAPWRQPHRRPW